MARWDLPADPVIAAKLVELEARQKELGVIGYLFGSGKNQPGNIGGAAMLFFGTILALVLFFGPDTPSFSKRDVVTLLGGFIATSLGYVFGQKTSGR